MNKDAYDALKFQINPIDEGELTPYEEAYYGQLPEFETMDKLFSEIIQRARKDGMSKCNPNKYEQNQKIQKIYEKVFGFKAAYIYWIPSATVNAYTINCQSLLLFGEAKQFIEKRKDSGFYDTSHRSVLTVYIYTGMLDERLDLTGREMSAIVLHEIGHNFDYSLYHMVEFILETLFSLGTNLIHVKQNKSIEDHNYIKMEYQSEIIDSSDTQYNNQEYRDKIAQKAEERLQRAANRGWFRSLWKLLITNLAAKGYSPYMPFMQLSQIGLHKGEQFADSFAAAYGYGLELISGLNKMDVNYGKRTKGGKGLEILDDLNKTSLELLIIISGECHGTNAERGKEVLKKLKKDIRKNDYPEGMKEELTKEIEKVEKFYFTLTHAEPDERFRITKFYRRIMDRVFGGVPNITRIFKPNKV